MNNTTLLHQRLMPVVLVCGLVFLLARSASAGDWNQWKGPNRDNRSSETGLNTDWQTKQPSLLKTIHGLGEGYSDLCFSGDKIYTMGDFNDRTYLIALDRQTLAIHWKTEIGQGGRINAYVGPKATPSSNGTHVYGLNQQGILCCLDAQTGKLVWQKSLRTDFSGHLMKRGPKGESDWGYAESPLLDGNRLICVPGGEKGSVIALNATTGDLLWRTESFIDNACYASIIPMSRDGRKIGLVMTESSFSGIAMDDGAVLWSVPFSGNPSLCCDPVWEGDRAVFSYATKKGFIGCHLQKEGNQFIMERTWTAAEVGNKHHGMIVHNGYVYTTTDRGGFLCLDIKTGEVKWKNRHLRGSYVSTYYDGCLILRHEKTGDLLLIEATPDRFIEKGTITQPNRSNLNAWTYPVVIDGKLYIRDQNDLFQYDLKR